VLCITGNGLKTTDVLTDAYQTEQPIAPKLVEFEAYLARKVGKPAAFAETPALPLASKSDLLAAEA
jgi:hypothetical protein